MVKKLRTYQDWYKENRQRKIEYGKNWYQKYKSEVSEYRKTKRANRNPEEIERDRQRARDYYNSRKEK
jgi:hypothetical protein